MPSNAAELPALPIIRQREINAIKNKNKTTSTYMSNNINETDTEVDNTPIDNCEKNTNIQTNSIEQIESESEDENDVKKVKKYTQDILIIYIYIALYFIY